LAALGLALGGAAANVPTSERFTMTMCAPDYTRDVGRMVRGEAVPVGTKDDMLVVPLSLGALLFQRLFCVVLPPGHPAIGWIKGALLGFYLIAAFTALSSFGLEPGKSLAACVLLGLSPACVYMTWMMTAEENFLSSALFFLAAALLHRMRRVPALALRLSGAAGVLALLGLALVLKDTTKGFVPPFLVLYLASLYRRERKVDPVTCATVAGGLLLTLGTALVLRQTRIDVPLGDYFTSTPLAQLAAKAAFMSGNALLQLVFCVHAAGALILYAAFRKRPGLGWVGAASWLPLVFSPPLVEINFHAMYIYPLGPAVAMVAAAVLMIVALVRVAARARFPFDLYAAVVLAAAALVAIFTFVFRAPRDDASTHNYLPVLPFLACLIVEAFGRWKPSRVRWVLLASVVYFLGVHIVNGFAARGGINRVEIETKRYLARQDLSDTVVLYNNDLLPVGVTDLSLVGAPPGALDRTRFLLFEPFKPPDEPEALRDEVCLKTLDLLLRAEYVRTGPTSFAPRVTRPSRERIDPKRTILFHEVYERVVDPDRAWPRSPWLRGFAGYGAYAPYIAARTMKPFARGYWNHASGEVLTDYYFGKEPDFARLGASIRAPEFEVSERYRQFPRWLEAWPLYLARRLPVATQVEAHGRARRISEAELGCLPDLDRLARDVGAWGARR
jgi:hypothetical protein